MQGLHGFLCGHLLCHLLAGGTNSRESLGPHSYTVLEPDRRGRKKAANGFDCSNRPNPVSLTFFTARNFLCTSPSIDTAPHPPATPVSFSLPPHFQHAKLAPPPEPFCGTYESTDPQRAAQAHQGPGPFCPANSELQVTNPSLPLVPLNS